MTEKIICFLSFLVLFTACAVRDDAGEESLLREKDREFVVATLGGLQKTSRVVLFTSRKDCEYCGLTESLLEDIAALAPVVNLEILDLEGDASRAAELGIDKAPGIAILGETDPGVRYYGLPTGFEFITFVDALRAVAEGDHGLMPETVKGLSLIDRPVKLTVFSTKT